MAKAKNRVHSATPADRIAYRQAGRQAQRTHRIANLPLLLHTCIRNLVPNYNARLIERHFVTTEPPRGYGYVRVHRGEQ